MCPGYYGKRIGFWALTENHGSACDPTAGGSALFPIHLPFFLWHTGAIGASSVGFSAKTTYGLLALMELAAALPGGDRLQVAEIAARQQIPERYLEQMMTSLRKGGLVHSSRGPRGGYQLARQADQITLEQAIHCLEGDPQASNATPPSSPEQQVVAQLADQLEQQRLHRLRSTSLAQLLERRDGLIQAQTMYFI